MTGLIACRADYKPGPWRLNIKSGLPTISTGSRHIFPLQGWSAGREHDEAVGPRMPVQYAAGDPRRGRARDAMEIPGNLPR